MNQVQQYYNFKRQLADKEKSIPELARLIKRARREKGFSIKELAEQMKINRSAVQHWEHGRRAPSAHNALQLSMLLEIPLEKLCVRTKRELLRNESNCAPLPRFFML